MATGTIGFGVLGAADIARRNMIPALAADPGIELAVIGSRSPERAAQAAAQFGCDAVAGYDAVLARDDVHAVYVPLPPALHAEWIERALLAGKHVLAEKPMTTDAGQTRRLVELARARGLVLLENFAWTRHSQHGTVAGLIADGAIGEVRSLSAEFGFPPLPPNSIRYDRELGGGALLDAGVYPLRAAQHVLGPDLAVAGAHLRLDPATGVDLSGSVLLATPDGRTAQATFGFDRSYRSAYTVWGSGGRITVPRAFSPPPTLRPTVLLERQDRVEEITVAADWQFARIVGHLLDLIHDPALRATGDAISCELAQLLDDVRDRSAAVRV